MKAITLWQPYASLMAIDFKNNETRRRATKFRGDLAICSAKRVAGYGEFGMEIEQLIWKSARELHGTPKPTMWHEKSTQLLPLGFVLCIVEVFDCIPTEKIKVRPLEEMLGNYAPGRFAWLTRNCRRMLKPVPVVGRQGFFFLPASVEKEVLKQL